MRVRKVLKVTRLPGYPDEIGSWLWAMEEVRRKTLRLVQALDQATLDWQGPDGHDNAIGTLLYHIAMVEMSWLFEDLRQEEFPPSVQTYFPHPMRTEKKRLTPVLGDPLDVHLDRLSHSRSVFLEAMRGMTLDQWERLRSPDDVDYEVTPAWAVFHLVEHEAGHAYQISTIQGRAARFLS